jgi:metallo-beta-lactamase family protein
MHDAVPRGAAPGRAPTLQFFGAAQTVTGSKYLLETSSSRVLVDCGLFQGLKELRERNWTDAVPDPPSLDAIVITHAHVDHCGHLPRLVAAGFDGPVVATPTTGELAAIVLPDCGHLQEEEAEYANRKGFSKHHPALPLYTEDDAHQAVKLFEDLPFRERRQLTPDVSIRFAPAGHILGSSILHLEIGDVAVTFSGDLGRPSHPLLGPPEPPPASDWLLVESTYGDRRHDDAGADSALAAAIVRTIDRGGSVLIPAFAVDRTEVLLHHLNRLMRGGLLPSNLPVFVDSPMALAALRVYRAAMTRGDLDVRPDALRRGDPFCLPGLREVHDVEGSKALNRPEQPCVIVSASGMLSGGRAVHHLAHLVGDPRNTIVLVGYQAAGTRGRSLLDGATELKLLGRYLRVRSEIVDLPAFSVHADAGELLDWIGSAPRPSAATFVVHGEPAASHALARTIRTQLDRLAVVPRLGERVRLDLAR